MQNPHFQGNERSGRKLSISHLISFLILLIVVYTLKKKENHTAFKLQTLSPWKGLLIKTSQIPMAPWSAQGFATSTFTANDGQHKNSGFFPNNQQDLQQKRLICMFICITSIPYSITNLPADSRKFLWDKNNTVPQQSQTEWHNLMLCLEKHAWHCRLSLIFVCSGIALCVAHSGPGTMTNNRKKVRSLFWSTKQPWQTASIFSNMSLQIHSPRPKW